MRAAAVLVAIAFSCAAPSLLFGQGKAAISVPAYVLPDFPRVNLAPWYEVDAKWPNKPVKFQWDAMAGIAVDEGDNIWTFNRGKPPVQVYRPDGKLVRSWGDDTILGAHHIRFGPDGNVWIADVGLHVVRKFTPDGKLLLTLGTPGIRGADEFHFHAPTDMAINPAGEIFVADGYGNNRLLHFDPQGKFIKQWGTLGVGPTEFSLPHALVMDAQGRLYVADRNNVRIQVYDQAGKLLDSWPNLIVPWGLALTKNDDLWVCGSSPMPWRDDPKYPGAPLSCPPKDQVLMRFNTQGKLLQLWTLPKSEDGKKRLGEVSWIHCLAADSQGNLYVGDILGKRAQKLVLKH